MAILTPYKRNHEEKIIASTDSLLLTAISRIRQLIESLFNQIDEKVKIQSASKVRPLKRVLTNVWSKLTVFMLVFSKILQYILYINIFSEYINYFQNFSEV